MTYLAMAVAGSMILAALAVAAAALTWAAAIRRMGERARRQEARAEARRLAPICEAELKPEYRSRGMVIDRLEAELEARGYKNADELAMDAVGDLSKIEA